MVNFAATPGVPHNRVELLGVVVAVEAFVAQVLIQSENLVNRRVGADQAGRHVILAVLLEVSLLRDGVLVLNQRVKVAKLLLQQPHLMPAISHVVLEFLHRNPHLGLQLVYLADFLHGFSENLLILFRQLF